MSAGAATVLARILEETRAQIAWRKRKLTLAELEVQAVQAKDSSSSQEEGRFCASLTRPGIAVIAEFKRRSPSAGRLREADDMVGVLNAYRDNGASALSVLTEGPNFDGSLEDLRTARAEGGGLPLLRKDFIVDAYQLYEARAAAADAVLLIVAALDQEELATLHELATTKLGLDVLVEVHDREELARAAAVGARLIGVNNRDLRDFSVDVSRTHSLLAEMPAGATVVSESGISAPEQLRELEQEGVSAVLVGEALMRADDPGRALATLLSGSAA